MSHHQDTPARLRIEGARLITGAGDQVIDEGVIVIADGVIQYVGKVDTVPAESGFRRIDASGKTVMPSIVSPHGHLGYLKGARTGKENYSRDNVLDHLRRLSYYGVGAFLSLGTDRDGIELQLREEQRSGRLAEPALPLLLTAGVGITAPTPGEVNGGPYFATDVVREVATPDDARRVVRELALKGPDAIKLWIDDRNGTKKKMQPDTYQAVISEAHAQGLKAVAHVYYTEDVKGVIRAGVDGIAHMPRDASPDGELIDLLATSETYAFTSMSIHAATAFGYDWVDDPSLRETMSVTDLQALKGELERLNDGAGPALLRSQFSLEKYELLEEGLRRYIDGGVKIVMSADTGLLSQIPGFAEHREMEAMCRAGMSPLRVIEAATSVPAGFLALPDRGVLEPGARADFLILDEDPLVDIRNARKISDVYLGGVAIDRASTRKSWSA